MHPKKHGKLSPSVPSPLDTDALRDYTKRDRSRAQPMSDNPIGEIVEAGTTQFVAQCLEVPRQIVPRLYDPPPLGTWVKIARPQETNSAAPAPAPPADPDEADPFAAPVPAAPVVLPAAVYALVCGASTSSLEPNRRPSALGYADEDEMRRQQPQIFELLRTEFSGLLLAYSPGDGKPLRRHLPPRPPRIHARVYECAPDEVRALTSDLSFLRVILLPSGGTLPGVPADELAAACLRQARDAHADDADFLLRAGKTLALLLSEDYDRLRALLQNVL